MNPALIVIVSCLGRSDAQGAFPPEPSGDLPKQVEAAARALGFHGVVLAGSPSSISFNQAFAKSEFPATTETRYWIASITKSFTATLIYKLQDEGRLTLSDKLSKFFPDASADKREITITQLLTHTSGLPDAYASEGVTDRTDAARRILALALVHPPGQTFGYSSDGYSLLAIIASIVAKTDYGDLIKQKIFKPAGMKDSGLWPVCPGKKPVMPLSTKLAAEMMRPNWGYKGPDGICSTTADLARFMIALLKGKILRPASLEAMWAGAVQVKVGRVASGRFLHTSPAGHRS